MESITNMETLLTEAEAGIWSLSISQTLPKSTLYALHQTPTQVTSDPVTPAGRAATTSSPEYK